MVDTGLAADRAVRAWRRILERSPAIGLLPILLILLFIFFGLYEPKFWRTANLINVLRNSSYLMIISAGQMLVLVIGGFDLSVGAASSSAWSSGSRWARRSVRSTASPWPCCG